MYEDCAFMDGWCYARPPGMNLLNGGTKKIGLMKQDTSACPCMYSMRNIQRPPRYRFVCGHGHGHCWWHLPSLKAL
jgi:hypothetical protein